MFKNSFSFEGRIRRTEYGLSNIIAIVALIIVAAIAGIADVPPLYSISLIPLSWFILSQGAKRCHDLGNNGWFQMIPFYALWMFFEEGKPGPNQYGDNPKGIQGSNQQNFKQTQNPQGVHQGEYKGEYSGGHNTRITSYHSSQNSEKTDGYQDGDLYN